MASAVANPQYMGYKALYRTVLEDSKRGIAKALRIFADPDAFPVLIHCIHGTPPHAHMLHACLLTCRHAGTCASCMHGANAVRRAWLHICIRPSSS